MHHTGRNCNSNGTEWPKTVADLNLAAASCYFIASCGRVRLQASFHWKMQMWNYHSNTCRLHIFKQWSNLLSGPFFSSSMADVALWLGPYMSISSKNVICTKTQKVRKCRQITTNQNHTNQPDDPQIPQPDLRFVKEEQQTRHTKGARAQTTTPTKRICQGTQWSDHCVTLKNMPKFAQRASETKQSFAMVKMAKCWRPLPFEQCWFVRGSRAYKDFSCYARPQ